MKHGGFLFNYWKSLLWVDFKIEFVLIVTLITSATGQEQKNKNLYIAMK